MASLPELQASFRAALLDDDEAGIGVDIFPDPLGVGARLAVYRHHVLTSLTATLAATFPVVCRLVDPRFFGWLADRYIRDCPPASPCLFEYGAGFPDFIARFPACAHLAWLADVARLEWAMNAAAHAPDAPPLATTWLAGIEPSALGRLVLRLHPSVTLLESRWPVDAIWRANQTEADAAPAVDLDAGTVRLEIRRDGDDVVLRALPPATFAFRDALAAGTTLEAAVQTALEVDPALDIAAELRALLDERLLAV